MSRKAIVSLIVASICMSAVISGCTSSLELSRSMSSGSSAVYKVTTRTIKDFKFEQPSDDPPKLKEDQTGTDITATFEQTVEKVDDNGNAIANVTIKSIQYHVKDKNEEKFKFDSGNEADMKKSFGKVVGQSYKITIMKDGKVAVLDAKAALAAVPGVSYEAKVAKSFFSDEAIIKRHEILSLPDADAGAMNQGDTWNRVEASPPGLLAPKSYEKVYTLTGIGGGKGNKVATIEMNASESAVPAEGTTKNIGGGMGPFAKMFDTQEEYTGKTVIETGTGKIQSYNENLVVTYTAAESPKHQKPDVGPDTLTMKFTYVIDVEAID